MGAPAAAAAPVAVPAHCKGKYCGKPGTAYVPVVVTTDGTSTAASAAAAATYAVTGRKLLMKA